MSTVYYHVRCPACDLIGPTIPFVLMPWDPTEIVLPAANLVTRDFESVRLPATEETDRVPLWQLAQAHSDATRSISSPMPGTGGLLELNPPIACPRCGARLTEARWRGPKPIVRELRSLEQVIEETRGLPHRAGIEFHSPDGSHWIECKHQREDDARLNRWYLCRELESEADLRPIADDLVARLTALGSRCEELEVSPEDGSFSEWPRSDSR